MAKHPCECCGHRTLDNQPGGTYQICPVCFWEDAPFAEDHFCQQFSNGITLRQAQRNYTEYGAATRDFLNDVRPAEPDEKRAPDWHTLDEFDKTRLEEVLDDIENAFRGVTRAGGVSLHETVEIDSYGFDRSHPNDNSDTGHDWRQVPTKDLAEVCGIGGISFLDPIGWRYYLPAYMTWWLNEGYNSDSIASDNLVYSLQLARSDSNGLRRYSLERYETLNTEQSKAVARFLIYIRDFAEDSSDREDAAKALDSYWQQFED
ncbi:MAG: DUF6714 family protein [Planctomycetota bacterium]